MGSDHDAPAPPTGTTGGRQRCQVCGYQAELRDGLMVHEGAALFAVTIYGCDEPQRWPATCDSLNVDCGRLHQAAEQDQQGWNLLRAKAIRVLHAHTNNAGLCGCCDEAWPCPRALLAEHNLALLPAP